MEQGLDLQINLANHICPMIFSEVITFDLHLYMYKQLHIFTCMNNFVEYNATQIILKGKNSSNRFVAKISSIKHGLLVSCICGIVFCESHLFCFVFLFNFAAYTGTQSPSSPISHGQAANSISYSSHKASPDKSLYKQL